MDVLTFGTRVVDELELCRLDVYKNLMYLPLFLIETTYLHTIRSKEHLSY